MRLTSSVLDTSLGDTLLELFVLTRNSLNYEKRKLIIDRLIPYIENKATHIFRKGVSSNLSRYSHYEPGEEWDFTLTLQNILESNIEYITYDSIIVKKPKKQDQSFIICIDKSLSVITLIHQIVLLTAVLSYATKKNDYAIVSFDNESHVIKSLNENKTVENVIKSVLSIESGGKTNIYAGLSTSLQQVKSSRKKKNRLILITDLQKTAGKDPLLLFPSFSDIKLIHVRSHRDLTLINLIENFSNVDILELAPNTDLIQLTNSLLQ